MFTWNVARMTDRLTDRSLTASFNLTNFPSRYTAVRWEVGGLTLPGSPLTCVSKKVWSLEWYLLLPSWQTQQLLLVTPAGWADCDHHQKKVATWNLRRSGEQSPSPPRGRYMMLATTISSHRRVTSHGDRPPPSSLSSVTCQTTDWSCTTDWTDPLASPPVAFYFWSLARFIYLYIELRVLIRYLLKNWNGMWWYFVIWDKFC